MGTKTQKLSNVVDQIVEWQAVFTGDGSTGLTAVAGRGYFIDTTSGTVTVTLPASPKIGDIVQLKDYARTWGTNNVSIASAVFDGVSTANTFSTNGQTITLVYMDGTKGWSLINEDTTTGLGTKYVTATGGTVTTSSDYKIHTFTGDGCFVVSQTATGTPVAPNVVDYLVIAGGGGGGQSGDGSSVTGGGGGAGGYRESSGTASGCYTVSPLGACVSALPVSATTYPVTVGGGGSSTSGGGVATAGSNSVFSTITSSGGGQGGTAFGQAPYQPSPGTHSNGGSGGSGGGGGIADNPTYGTAGTGNTPPVSPPQGNNGGVGFTPSPISTFSGAGGGGATAVGGSITPSSIGGSGGNGATSSINTTPTARAGGGGGGGGASQTVVSSGAGGSGIVIIRYKYQ